MSSTIQALTPVDFYASTAPDHAEMAALIARGRRLQAQAIRAAFAAIFHLPARLAARGRILDGSAVQEA